MQGLDEYVFLCTSFLAIAMFFDALWTFSNPFRRSGYAIVMIIGVFVLSAIFIIISICLFSYNYLVVFFHIFYS